MREWYFTSQAVCIFCVPDLYQSIGNIFLYKYQRKIEIFVDLLKFI